MTVNKRNTASTWINPDDAPELTEEFFEKADVFVGKKLVRRGRPQGSAKTSTTVRFDDEVLAAFRATGRGWQTRMNAALIDWLRTHKPQEV
jgi:uncharacterized protein (DUF4415 family)